MGARGSLFASVTFQASDYKGTDPTFLTTRDDDYIDVTLGYKFRYDGNWSVTPRLSYSSNDSNIVVNDYDRFDLMVVVRNDF